MGMSTHIVGFRPPDEKWEKMKRVWDSCLNAGVKVPQDVLAFFNYEAPDESGIKVEIDVEAWSDESASGYEIDLECIPENVRYIRFYNVG